MTTSEVSAAPAFPVAILGGGLTGLTAAWHLRKAGVPVVVFEASTRAGGVIGATRHAGWLHENGPNSLLASPPAIANFIEELGLGPRCIQATATAKKRFIVRGGRPISVPASPASFIASRLLSWRAKLSLLGEPFRPPGPPGDEETVAQFVTRRLGSEFLDYLINPFVAGVYAGDPRRLSVKHAFPKLHALEQAHGSLIRGAFKRRNARGGPSGTMLSFPDGLEELPRALARGLGGELRTSHAVQRIQRTPEGYALQLADAARPLPLRFRAVICALPADALARLRFDDLPAANQLSTLSAIEQPPVASVFTGYRREQVAHALDGFGTLVPEAEKRRILGTLFSSTLFPGRAPEGHVALTTFVGGMRQPALARLGDGAIVDVVCRELAGLLGAKGEPVYVNVHRWPRAIPQYDLDFQRFKDACTAVERAAPGIYIGGNARDGISLANCIESGRRLAAAAAASPAFSFANSAALP
jgi:protoporphyrinogen/coproporphyrinogen III oxidase